MKHSVMPTHVLPNRRDVSSATILIVDDSPEDCAAARIFLTEAGRPEGLAFRFHESATGAKGLAAFDAETPDCILLDHLLPDMNALEFLNHLRHESGEVPVAVVVFTGTEDRLVASAALRAGAQEYLPKRLMGPEMVLRAVESAQDRFRLHAERRRAAQALAENEERLRLTQAAAGIGTWEWEVGTDAMCWSPENFDLHGLPGSSQPLRHADWLATIHPADRELVNAVIARAVAAGDGYEVEYRVVLPDGGIRWLGGRGSLTTGEMDGPGRMLGVSLDISARHVMTDELARMNDALERRVNERTAALVEESSRRLEAETLLHQAQKMEAIGQLTGGLAHDFNNSLQVVTGNLEIALRRLQAQTPAVDPAQAPYQAAFRRPVENAHRAAKSAAGLTQRLLAFGRRQMLAPTVLDVNSLVAGLSEMIRRTLGETIGMETLAGPDVWPVFADANQLEAALLNLVVNARDAMPAGGRLTIATANVNLDAAFTLPLGDVRPGGYVLLSITDSGTGIPADVLGRVFEPFFTTKPFGYGTGLGLAMVYGFVRQSDGHVRIDSEVGAGTTVKVYLPRFAGAGREAVPSPLPVSGGRSAPPRARAGETILLVEDEQEVQNYVQEALEDLGYRVLTAATAAEALVCLEASSRAGVDLLFTDVLMPGGADGLALAMAAAERWPALPVLFTTGYSPNAIIAEGGLDSRCRVIGKPYSFDALARKVRECLDGAAGR